ncbi:MAG: chemotaxis protein CheW [Holosporales bacterium]|jgi:purine-binding chemotaxis protein CheW
MTSPDTLNTEQQYVTLVIADQLFGIPVLDVHDVLKDQRINFIPLAPNQVAGSLNLRGRIVTAIDMRRRLGVEPEVARHSSMSLVVENQGEMYSLMVDSVGEVLSLPSSRFEKTPATIEANWREVARGVFRLEKSLMIVLDVEKLFPQIVENDAEAA